MPRRPSPPYDTDQHSDQHLPTPAPDISPKPLALREDPINNYYSHSPRPHLKPPSVKRTSPLTWLTAICCALLWIFIILAGLTVLIIYLIFHPRNPRLDITQATLNAAYLDIDVDSNTTLLNADLTLLTNFSNPNHKVDVVFTLLELDLYFREALVAAAAVDAFAERRRESALRSVHLVASQVVLSEKEAEEWRRQEEDGVMVGSGGRKGLVMEVRGTMRTRLVFGGLMRFSYWLHCRCRIVVAAPPDGALREVSCAMKR